MKITESMWSSGNPNCGGRMYKKLFVHTDAGELVGFALCENESEFSTFKQEFIADFTEE